MQDLYTLYSSHGLHTLVLIVHSMKNQDWRLVHLIPYVNEWIGMQKKLPSSRSRACSILQDQLNNLLSGAYKLLASMPFHFYKLKSTWFWSFSNDLASINIYFLLWLVPESHASFTNAAFMSEVGKWVMDLIPMRKFPSSATCKIIP